MYYYDIDGCVCVSHLLLPEREIGAETALGTENLIYLVRRDPIRSPEAFCPSHGGQLFGEESIGFLDRGRMDRACAAGPELPPELLCRIDAGSLRAVNYDHPRFREILKDRPKTAGLRLQLVALGDVGATLLMALRLLGRETVESIGIYDVRKDYVQRWVFECEQMTPPFEFDAFPRVYPLEEEDLFHCDAFLFAAAKGVPPVEPGAPVKDVRMAQLEANRGLVEYYAGIARRKGYRGWFFQISDPVDPLAMAVYLASNRDESGAYDGKGLLPSRVRGFGLGVMNARAAYYAKGDERFSSFLTEGRAYGPHGEGLVIADSIEHYDDALSKELTDLALHANLRMRELGFKPYAAPAVSSAALNILALLRGEWNYSSALLDGCFFGRKNKETPCGLLTETLPLPEGLFARLEEAHTRLRSIR